MATYNTGMKVNRAITGATTVTANSYAVVTYVRTNQVLSLSLSADGYFSRDDAAITRSFGPGQSIPASFTVAGQTYIRGSGSLENSVTSTYTLQSGYEIINTN